MTSPALALDRVTVRYDTRIAVREASASMTTGRWSALIGPNGAGKSSLLRAMADLIPYEGELRIFGEDSGRLARRRRSRLLAYVPQEPALPAGMSVLEYALLGRTPHIGYFGTETERDRRVCAEALDRLGLADLAERHLSTLSGGQRQRVVLARALAQEAPVLLLDEPTSALDLGRRVESLELVDELRHERGLTVVSAMHDLTLAAQFAHHMVLLHAGRVAASGPPAAVLDDTLLSECFGGRVRVIADGDGGLLVTTQRNQPNTRSRT